MLSIKRLRKENLALQNEPVPLAVARPLESNILEWRFLIKGSDDYEGGYYHGKLIFPPQYPMKPPGIMFFTPSGRFEINKRVCLTISDFHPETWSPLWTVGSILTGIVSFMNSDEITTGGLASSSKDKKAFAMASTAYNAKDHTYVEIYGSQPPNEIFEEADKKIEENVKKRLELRDIQQKALEVNRIPDSKAAAGGANVRPAFTNGTSSKTRSDTTPTSPTATIEVGAKAPGITKSAKKRQKEKERANRTREGNADGDMQRGQSIDSDSENENESEEKGKGSGSARGSAESAHCDGYVKAESISEFSDLKISGDA
jgi:ubiquitin-conjugating enzyme E2 J2